MNWEAAIRGMRNPLESHHKSDSLFGICDVRDAEQFDQAETKNLTGYLNMNPDQKAWITYLSFPYAEYVHIGENDMDLAQRLIKGGSEHRKFMRQIFVSVDITAPIYWWKEFDTYKVGTVANSTSTMHKLATTPITKECFDTDDLIDYCTYMEYGIDAYDWKGEYYDTYSADDLDGEIDKFINILEGFRRKYLETKDKRYWKELIRWLPESWLQTRTITLNYENLLAMYNQRKNHKLNEWSGQDNPTLVNFISWVKQLPYANELILVDAPVDKDD